MLHTLLLLAGVMIAAGLCRWAIEGCGSCLDGEDYAYEVFFGGVLVAGWLTCELIRRLFLHVIELAAMGVS